jgi:hypothetical protein
VANREPSRTNANETRTETKLSIARRDLALPMAAPNLDGCSCNAAEVFGVVWQSRRHLPAAAGEAVVPGRERDCPGLYLWRRPTGRP